MEKTIEKKVIDGGVERLRPGSVRVHVSRRYAGAPYRTRHAVEDCAWVGWRDVVGLDKEYPTITYTFDGLTITVDFDASASPAFNAGLPEMLVMSLDAACPGWDGQEVVEF